MEGKPHVNLIVLTPGHSATGDYIKSLLATCNLFNEKGITWAHSMAYASHVGDAREMTLSGSAHNTLDESRPLKGELTYDKLLWIDSDISWKPEDVWKLYQSDKDIVGGAYLLSNGSVAAYPTLLKRGYTAQEVLALNTLTKIGGIGFGFICVKQGIFEKLTRPWFQSVLATHVDDDGVATDFPIMGEDLSWCKRVSDLGYDIWLDPSVKLTHQKTMKLEWEYFNEQ